MSYCRFSSDNWRSEAYVYNHFMGGWMIHVAGSRILGDIPQVPDSMEDPQAWLTAHQAQMAFLDTAKRELITLPHAGDTFDCATAGECAAKLLELRAIGYHVPQSAIDALLEEDAS